MEQAKKVGKLRNDYQIPKQFRNNYPHVVSQQMASIRQQGDFSPFPFGTDFTEQERVVGKALKALKRKSRSKGLMIRLLIKAIFTLTIPKAHKPYLERMGLWQTKGLEEKLFRNLLANELKTIVTSE